jgi:hypothetical protein
MAEAVTRLKARVYQPHSVKQCTEFHLKFGQINYYPQSGKVMVDGQRPRSDLGWDVFMSVLQELKVPLRNNTSTLAVHEPKAAELPASTFPRNPKDER